MKNLLAIIVPISVVFVLWALLMLGLSYLFQVVWNFVMPHVFGLPVLGYWYAVGMVFLLGFVAGGIKYSRK